MLIFLENNETEEIGLVTPTPGAILTFWCLLTGLYQY